MHNLNFRKKKKYVEKSLEISEKNIGAAFTRWKCMIKEKGIE